MKNYLTLIFLSILCTTLAFGQDTTKSTKPANSRRLLHPQFGDMFLTPQQMQKKLAYRDSVFERSRPPEERHPILYADGGFGASFGLQGNYSVNYQYGKSLFTFRGLGVGAYEPKPATSTKWELFQYRTTRSLSQYALLYGWRISDNRHHAYSFSLGIAADDYNHYNYFLNNQPREDFQSEYVGLPFEVNYQWFGRRFGAGFGLKLSGDISQHSFIGFGVDMSLGFHTHSNGGKNTSGQH